MAVFALESGIPLPETVQMKPNDLLFLYTDGLSEALNVEGEEFGSTFVVMKVK